jgi:NADH-quinone oxidoreductase subunit C
MTEEKDIAKVEEPKQPKKGWDSVGEFVESEAANLLIQKFPGTVRPANNPAKEAAVFAAKTGVIEVLSYLKEEPSLSFDYLSDLTAVHFPENEKKMVVVYHLYSISRQDSLRVKVELDENESCPSCVSIWPAANWMEREAFDLMGVSFDNHPNLKRILLPDEWEGHPLRKEYPLGGPQEAEIRANKFGKPQLLPDDLEAARIIIEEGKNGK